VNPSSKFYLFWTLVNLCFVLYTAIVVPVRIPFEEDTAVSFLVIDTLIDIFFMLDMMMNFNLAYENEESELITN
jgi:hypothetical protein